MSDIFNQWERITRSYESDPRHEVVNFRDQTPELIDWLWPGRLPAGKLVVIDGDPSTAKSTLTTDLAARVTNGGPWPDGSPCSAGDVLLLSAEDGIRDTITPRLMAAGADLDHVHALVRVEVSDDEGRTHMALPSLPRDVGVVLDLVRQYSIKLVIVDVLMAYLSGRVDAHRDQDVRGVLHELAQLAESTGATIILIRHLNKGTGGNPLYRGGGSIGIVGAARAAFLIARDPDDRDRLVMVATKSNLAANPPALAFRLQSVPELGVARVQWETGPVEFTADALLSGPSTEEDRDEADEAVEWLQAHLEDRGGSDAAKDIFKAARSDGILDRRLQRARRRAGVISQRRGFGGGAIWSLAESLPQDHPQSGDSVDLPPQNHQQPVDEDRTVIPIRDTPGPIPDVHVSTQTADVNVTNGSPGVVNGDGEGVPRCVYCGLPLPESAILDGFDCHAGCQDQP